VASESFKRINSVFYPSSIAMVGASPNLYKWGSFLLANLIKGGFKGPIYPVNPREKTIFSRPCYPSLAETPGPVELAIVVVPVAHVKKVITECIAKQVKAILLITSGFSEAGKAGHELELEIAAMVREAGIRLVGPNTMGIINTHADITVTGSHTRPLRGAISLVSQSGNLGGQVLGWAENMGIGINKFVGTGNEGDVNVTDMIEYFREDETTKIILAYFEGVEDGQRFLEVARKTSMEKPIIALKGGRTSAGSRAAMSHTGSLAGSYPITLGALAQAGVIVAKNPTELIDFSIAFQHLPLPQGNRVGVITLGGGWGVVASDECNERGLVLPELPEEILTKLDKLLPSFWSRGNPIDLVGQINPAVFRNSLEAVTSSEAFDAVLDLGNLGTSHFMYRVVSTVRDIDPSFDPSIVQIAINEAAKLEAGHLRDVGDFIAKYNKPILTVSHSEKLQYAIPFGDNVVVAYPTPEKAIRALQAMLWYRNWKAGRTKPA
jgi:acyl-CoA synthetase (NDP forming)